MHIGIVGPTGADTFADNIGASLACMGHQVTQLGSAHVASGGRHRQEGSAVAFRALPGLEARYQNRLVRRALERECDAVITSDAKLSPTTVAAFRRHQLPVALWFPDCVANLGGQRMLAAPYTALFFKDPLLVRRLTEVLDLPAFYLPEACNPVWHRPMGEAGSERRIVVVGNTYPSRARLVRRLYDAGIPVAIYGGPPARDSVPLLPPKIHTGYPVYGDEKSRVFRSAAAVLNNLHPAEMNSVNCRLFEATAAGGAVLCERREVLSELFDVDREVVQFGSYHELVERIRDLLDNPQRTAEIGDLASKRAHSEHTYANRLPEILKRLL